MRRIVVYAALITTLLVGGVMGPPEGLASPRLADSEVVGVAEANRGPCTEDRYRVVPAMGLARVRGKVAALIRCAVAWRGVPGGATKAIDVADCESSLWPWAGTYNLGVFQHARPYWIERVDWLLRESWFNPQQWDRLHTVPQGAYLARANVLVAIRMAHAGGWGPWACAT